ncbi:Phosphatidylinositol 4-kinase beta, partial [Cichlidogyrus casuarinus]
SQLSAELVSLNLKLPARVWLPVHKKRHVVLRIPPNEAVCLNSKDRAPFLVYVEILECDDIQTVQMPTASERPSRCTSMLSLAGNSDPPRLSQMESSSSLSSQMHPEMSALKAIAAPDVISFISSDSLLSEESRELTRVQLHRSRSCIFPGCAASVTEDSGRPILGPRRFNPTEGDLCEVHEQTLIADLDKQPPTSESQTRVVSASEIRERFEEFSDRQPSGDFQADPDDPSAAVLKEPWEVKCARIQASSPWGHLPGWKLTSAIVKVGDDLRQEQMAYQLLRKLQQIWQAEGVNLWLRPLKIVATSADSGLIEPIPDTVSFHQIHRHSKLSLLNYMIREHGSLDSSRFLQARQNFMESCAAYCIVGYLFRVKDRHNGNILLDNEGHVIHIDYGFMLSSSPGNNFDFEKSPFKLTMEQVAVMGGINSRHFMEFRSMILRGLVAARKHMDEICLMVDIQRQGYPRLPCFSKNGKSALKALRRRFHLTKTKGQMRRFVHMIVDKSLRSFSSWMYDTYQYYTNGIHPSNRCD